MAAAYSDDGRSWSGLVVATIPLGFKNEGG